MRIRRTIGTALNAALGLLLILTAGLDAGPLRLRKDVLRDKVRGGWAGQVIGCTFGGPTEFRFQGTFIQDYQPLVWDPASVAWYMKNAPGLYDDVYMDLTFVEVIKKEGLSAPAGSFAKAFAGAPYPLWHANQMGRYNVLHGLRPPASGSWRNNPHADDIDFQIEADFAGLMSPGMVNAAAEICDRVGHIMNSGDGWYGGVYVAAMYALAFTTENPETIAHEALAVIPEGSRFRAVMTDVLRWHRENPADWHETWFKVQRKWSEDIGCPDGVFSPFNIDAKVNAAWVLIGLLYGDGDFGRTLDIAARCGDDSDCNPATAGGILGAALGYSRIPESFRAGLTPVEGLKFPYTDLTLAEVYDLSYAQALAMIERNGGKTAGDEAVIGCPPTRPVALEVNFPGMRPTEVRRLDAKFSDMFGLDFEGTGVVVTGEVKKAGAEEGAFVVEASLDGAARPSFELPTDDRTRRDPLFWAYGLPAGRHHLELKVAKVCPGEITLRSAVIYGPESGGRDRK